MKTKKILVICPYPEKQVPAQRLKYEQYFKHFEAAGYEITVKPFIEESFYKFIFTPGNLHKKIIAVLWGYLNRLATLPTVPLYDGIYVFLYVTPFGSPLFEFLYRMAARGMIYDIDDLAYMGKTSRFNRFIGFLRGKAKYNYLMKSADHVITCTPYLDKYVRQFNQKTTDISSTIRTDDYQPVNPYTNEKTLLLGWSGSHSTAPYLKILHAVLLKLREKIPFRLRVIGDAEFTLPGLEIEALPWREKTEVEDLQKIDIGLYPLPQEEWVLGKSGLKALQYMALGIPTVATAIGANYRVIEEGESGFLVKTEEEWLDRLEKLARDPSLRKKIGLAARERVEKLYSVNANKSTYLNIFATVFGKP
jgi:glycosyltransferase involved in cell wall biosynthesis